MIECPVKPHLDLSHRYLSTKVKWNNPVAVFQSKFRMENDAQLEQGRFTFNHIHRYLHDGCYPSDYTKPDKLHVALRKRAKFLCTRGADLDQVSFRLRPTPAMLNSNIHPQHTYSPCTSTCTTHPAIPSQLPSTTLLCT